MTDKQDEKTIEKLKSNSDILIALAGNPNVGKSTLFNSLTGLGVHTANYSGKTVELNCGVLRSKDKKIGIVDLPGIYYLGTDSDDLKIASKAIFEIPFDVIVYIVDTTNLARNLYLLLQLIELGLPLIAALNFTDSAEKKGVFTDTELLSKRLGIPVVPISAMRGDGIPELVEQIEKTKNVNSERIHKFSFELEENLNKIEATLKANEEEWEYYPRKNKIAPLLMEGNLYCRSLLKSKPIHESVETAVTTIREKYKTEEPESIIIKERYGLAGELASAAQTSKNKKASFSEKLWSYTTYPLTGIPILLAVSFTIIYILFKGGALLADFLDGCWKLAAEPYITALISAIFGNSIWGKVFNWGFNDGLIAAITVGIPYVLIFYFILSFLEDTGYLNAAAFLVDKAMHTIGLHSKAFMPLAAAIGCSVPAVIGTRILNSKREKIIAITLIVIIACSARTAVIFGAVSKYIGLWWAISIIMINVAVVIGAGLLMNIFTKGEQEGQVLEIFPMRRPNAWNVLKKTWIRFADFLWIATPIVIAGSMVIGWLYETGNIWALTKPLKPIVEDWLGLPPFAGIALFFAVLRKELALQFLLTLASAQTGHENALTSFMTQAQIYVFTLFNTLYMPCIATIAVIIREIGWRWCIAILATTLSFTILLSGIASKLILYFHIL